MSRYLLGSSLRPRTRSREVVVNGKKRLKRQGRLPIQEVADLPPMSFVEQLEFGKMMGLTVEDVIKHLKKQSPTGELELDDDAKAYLDKLEKQKTARKRMIERTDRAVDRDVEWEELKKKLGDDVKTVPVWATATQYDVPQVNYEDVFPEDDEIEDSRNDYGRFLLDEEEAIPEDFRYKDLEVMISQLPDNLVKNGRWYDEEVPKIFQERKKTTSSEKKRSVPALAPKPSIHGHVFEETERMKAAREEREREAKEQIRTKKPRACVRLIRPIMPSNEEDQDENEDNDLNEDNYIDDATVVDTTTSSEQLSKKTASVPPLRRPSNPQGKTTRRSSLQSSTAADQPEKKEKTSRRKVDREETKQQERQRQKQRKRATLKKPSRRD